MNEQQLQPPLPQDLPDRWVELADRLEAFELDPKWELTRLVRGIAAGYRDCAMQLRLATKREPRR